MYLWDGYHQRLGMSDIVAVGKGLGEATGFLPGKWERRGLDGVTGHPRLIPRLVRPGARCSCRSGYRMSRWGFPSLAALSKA